MSDGVRYLTTGQVAKACQVSLMAVKKWIRQGKLKAFQTPGGHFRIAEDEFQRFRTTHHFPVEREGPPRILVVDDDPRIVELLLRLLETTRPIPKLEGASNGYEGLLKVGTFRPHLLVLDLRMPELDGYEVCRRIKGDPATQTIKVLTLTAYADESAREEALKSGADAFLTKPFVNKALLAQVKELIQSRG